MNFLIQYDLVFHLVLFLALHSSLKTVFCFNNAVFTKLAFLILSALNHLSCFGIM